MVLDDEQLTMLGNGIMLPARGGPQHAETVAFDKAGRLIAILVPHAAGKLRPTINFAPLLTAGSP